MRLKPILADIFSYGVRPYSCTVTAKISQQCLCHRWKIAWLGLSLVWVITHSYAPANSCAIINSHLHVLIKNPVFVCVMHSFPLYFSFWHVYKDERSAVNRQKFGSMEGNILQSTCRSDASKGISSLLKMCGTCRRDKKKKIFSKRFCFEMPCWVYTNSCAGDDSPGGSDAKIAIKYYSQPEAYHGLFHISSRVKLARSSCAEHQGDRGARHAR